MSVASSSLIPAVLAKLGPLNPDGMTDLRVFLKAVPDPRSRRGRWYSLTPVLLVCAAAAVPGARVINELAGRGARAGTGLLATLGVRRYPLHWRHAPSRPATGRVPGRPGAGALDAAVGAWLAHRHAAAAAAPGRRRVIVVDGKTLRGSARLNQPRRRLLSAVTHGRPVTLAQAEAGSKTNGTRHVHPLLAPLDPDGDVVTFDALHTVKANTNWLAGTKKAHCIAVIKASQPTAWTQMDGLDWHAAAIQHTTSAKGHGRRESRPVKTPAIAGNPRRHRPHAKPAIRVHRRRKETDRKETRETLYAVTSLNVHQATPAELASHLRGHWSVEARHHIRNRTFADDTSSVHAGNAPRAMATFRNLAIAALKTPGCDQHRQDHPRHP